MLALALMLAACAASPTAPDLERLYRTARSNPEQPPLILIPGVLGSRLADSRGREVWPGTLWKLLSSRYPELALRIDPHTLEPVPDALRPAGLFASASGREYYSRILAALDQVTEGFSATPGMVALAWLMAQPTVTAPIASATSLAQLQELARTTELKPGRQAMDQLDQASAV